MRCAVTPCAVLQERVKAGEVVVKHMPDPQNAADFLTKWVGIKKLKESVAYTTNEYAKGAYG